MPLLFPRNPRKYLTALVLSTLAGAASAQLPEHPAIGQEVTPAWVVEQEITDPPSGEGEEIRYLLVDQQIRLPAKGAQQVYRRFTYRVESRTALEEWSSWQIAIEPSFEKLLIHDLRVRRDGAWQGRLERSRASMLQREAELEQQIFDGRQTLLLVFDDIRVGDVVDISYSMLGSNPLFGDRFDFASWLGWSLPVARAHLRLLFPTSRAIQIAPLAGAPEPERSQEGQVVTLFWQLEDLELVEGESGTPPSTLTYPLVDMSEYRDWAEVVAWGLPIYRTRPSPELEELAQELREQHQDPWHRLAAARNWVQDEVRYFAALMGAHSHAPHGLADILQRRYGDCKDKTLLLLHLLEMLDIEAWPVLVHSEMGLGLQERLPSPGVFDHVIVAAAIDDKKIWVDPTLSLQGGKEALSVPAYGYGLELRAGTTDLSLVEVPAAAIPRTEALYTYRYQDPSLPVELEIRTRYIGSEAESLRRSLTSTTLEDLQTNFLDYYSSETHSLEVRGELETNDDRDANTLETVERYLVTYEDESGQLDFSILPLLLENDLGYPDEIEERRMPWALPYPLRRDEIVVLETPDAATYSEVSLDEDNPHFHFKVDTETGPGFLKLIYHLETKAPAVNAPDLPAYVEAMDRMWAELGYGVWKGKDQIIGDSGLRLGAALAYGAALALLLCYGAILAFYLRSKGLLGAGP